MPRYTPASLLPPYSYVPGHELPHPVNDPAGHLYAARDSGPAHEPLMTGAVRDALPAETDKEPRRRALAALLAGNSQWLVAIDLFNAGFYWESHEAWEAFWHALGRTTSEARFIQGLIHVAAACVKIREGKPAGVERHTRRARELFGEAVAAEEGGRESGSRESGSFATLGITPESLPAVLGELEAYRPECWHASRFSVVKVLVAELQVS
jgi:hypothetical protein